MPAGSADLIMADDSFDAFRRSTVGCIDRAILTTNLSLLIGQVQQNIP